MYEIIPKNKYRYVGLLMIAGVSTCLQMLSPISAILHCHLGWFLLKVPRWIPDGGITLR